MAEERGESLPKKHGPWTILRSELKYEHMMFEVREDEVIRPDGEPGSYAVVNIKAGSSVIAVDDDENVYLTHQFRYAAGHDGIEVASGGLDEGEDAREAARRELREELGIEAGELIELGTVDPLPSLADAPSYLFIARDLEFKQRQQEGSEDIRTVKLPLSEAMRMVYDGRINHGASCVLILRAAHYLHYQSGEDV